MTSPDSSPSPGSGPTESTDPFPDAEPRLSRFDHEGLAPVFFAVLFIGCGLALLYVLKEFFTDVVLGFVLVGLFGGVYRRLVSWLGGRRWLASAAVTGLVLIAILVPLVGLVITIVQDAAGAYQSAVASSAVTSITEDVGTRLQRMLAEVGIGFSPEHLRTLVLKAAQGIQGVAVGWGSALLGNTLSAVVHFAVILIVVFYTLVDGESFKAFAFELSPLPDDEDAVIVETFKKVAAGVVVGNGLGSALQGLLGGLAMAVVGLSSPVLWGSVMAIAAFLPLVGISAVVLPASAYLALQGRPWVALGFFAFCTIQGLIVENVVKTKLIGSRMRMHDLLVFLCVLGGVAAFGVAGLVYGPLIAMLFITLNSLYRQRYRPQLAQRYVLAHPMQNIQKSPLGSEAGHR
jgi:predicted PurR-regulated permease PerM